MRCGTANGRDANPLKASTASAAGLLFRRTPEGGGAPAGGSHASPDRGRRKKEGKLSYYSALELNTAERLAENSFEAKYPGIAVRVERSGGQRNFQRIAQEQGSGIKAVDVANSTDPAHYLEWKKNDWLAPYVTEDVAKHFPADQIDPDGMYATSCAWMEVIGYNTSLVKREDAPKSMPICSNPEWPRQDGQGPSGLQRRHPDRNVRAGARSGLAVFGKARAAEGDAGAMSRRSAEEDPAWRARRHGRRQRLQSGAGEGSGQTGRSDLPGRRRAADHRSIRGFSAARPIRCGKAVPELLLQRGGAANAGRRFRPPIVSYAGQGEGRAYSAGKIEIAKADPAQVQQARRSRRATARFLECERRSKWLAGARVGWLLRNYTGRKGGVANPESGKQREDTPALPDAVDVG